MSALTLDDILALATVLYGDASITVTRGRAMLWAPGAPDRVNVARVDGEPVERTLARDLVAHGEIAQIIARREQVAANYEASAAAARARVVEAHAALERLRAAAEVTP